MPISIDSINKSDAIVVLSGMLDQVGDENNFKYEWVDPDRFFGGLELLKKNKSDLLIFTAGQLPWTNNRKPEGLILKEKAIELGIIENKILITENVKNTYEESLEVLKLTPKGSSIILVTSAFHMERSKYLFEKQGFKVNPFPVDFKISNKKLTILDIIPSYEALKKTSIFIKENIGRLYYRIIFQLT
ncbi:YdcF family protein [Pseudomonadota bacterium]|nr:YdcF family protein [Pseudomonadota bacterium]